MTVQSIEQIVHDLALELSHASDCRVLIETDRRKVLGREVIELRVFLRQSPWQMTADQWVWLYRDQFASILDSAGLELAADEWFTPSQRFSSCGCWICPIERRLKTI
jgi:hypothetical protein